MRLNFYFKGCLKVLFLFLLTFKSRAEIPNKKQVYFTENKGQVTDQFSKPRKDILYKFAQNNLQLFFKKNGFSYQLTEITDTNFTGQKKENKFPELEKKSVEIKTSRVDVEFVKSNPFTKINPGEANNYYENYILETAPHEINNVKTFNEIFYKSLYKGIDLNYYVKDGGLKYDFIVSPGADYKLIKFQVNGSENIAINNKGQLVIKTNLGDIIEEQPTVYQGDKKVEASWAIDGKIIGFKIGAYDKTKTLTIDPLVLVRHFGSYYGGLGSDRITDIKLNSLGEFYIGGYTSSYSDIATAGAYQTVFLGGNGSGFLAKFTNTGVRLWATYYSSPFSNMGIGQIVIDKHDGIHVLGTTDSPQSAYVTTPGAHQTVYGGGAYDAFYSKFSPAGIRLYATYYGGSSDDMGVGIAVDKNKNVFVSGQTKSLPGTGIETAGAYQTVFNTGPYDAFLVKFDSMGVRQWGTYYGDIGNDVVSECDVDESGNVLIYGVTTFSTDQNIATPGSHQPNFGGGFFDTYLVKFNTNGNRLWATFYGGTNDEFPASVATDSNCNIYIGGYTGSSNFGSIATPGSYQPTKSGFGGLEDAFIVKFDSLGVRQWGTYYGGSSSEYLRNLQIQKNLNYILVCGKTSYNGLDPHIFNTPDAHNFGYTGPTFYSVFDLNGNRIHSSYFGVEIFTEINSLCMNNSSELFIAGQTKYSNYANTSYLIGTIGAHQPIIGQTPVPDYGYYDGFFQKFGACPVNVSVTTLYTTSTSCIGGNQGGISIEACGGSNITYSWAPVTSTANTMYSLIAGNYTCNISNSCGNTITYTASVLEPTLSMVPSLSPSVICQGDTVNFIVDVMASYNWDPQPALYSNNFAKDVPLVNTTYTIMSAKGFTCPFSATTIVNVIVNPFPSATLQIQSSLPNDTICLGDALTIWATGATSYTWNNGSNSFFITVSPSVTTTYSVIGVNNNGCVGTKSRTTIVMPCVGMHETESDVTELQLSPNPTSGNVILSGNLNKRKLNVEVIDVLGKQILQADFSNVIVQLNLSDQPKGIYFVKIFDSASLITVKKICVE